jgi:hypothetical protein
VQYRCLARGITCEAILTNTKTKVFRYFGFTSDDIRIGLESLRSLNLLEPMGLTVINDLIYKIDKSLFHLMSELNSQDFFNRIEQVMRKIWFNYRHPTDDEKKWLDFIYGNKEAARIISDAYEARRKIFGGKNLKAFVKTIVINDKMRLESMNKRIDEINEEIKNIQQDMQITREVYKTHIEQHETFLNNIFETVYPGFFSSLRVPRFS